MLTLIFGVHKPLSPYITSLRHSSLSLIVHMVRIGHATRISPRTALAHSDLLNNTVSGTSASTATDLADIATARALSAVATAKA